MKISVTQVYGHNHGVRIAALLVRLQRGAVSHHPLVQRQYRLLCPLLVRSYVLLYKRVVAYRTALQPDEKRGYAHAVIVAVDLRHTYLHFVLGYEEPVSDNKFDRPGAIPKEDFQPGIILGAFNGGFQAKHGQFGAMADGQVALPARDGFGTIAIYKDGRVDLGVWGTDIQASPDMQAWRPMVR